MARTVNSLPAFIPLISVLFILATCRHSPDISVNQPDHESSKFDLPYPAGTEYVCMQGWHGSISHSGVFSFAVDFTMTCGTIVTASRAGTIEWIESRYSNSDPVPGHENLIIIRHADTLFSRYVHLSPGTARVKVGQTVNAGDTLGLSGQSGTPIPHLHFDVTKGCNDRDCQTVPVLFRNTIAQPEGPQAGTAYPAR